MEHSVDYSTRTFVIDADWDDALAFIKSKSFLGLHFEVVLADAISLNAPNHSPEPTGKPVAH